MNLAAKPVPISKLKKSLRESISRLEKEMSVARSEGNARKIASLNKIIKCFKLKLEAL